MPNTIVNQATAASLQTSDYFLTWQNAQSPSTRKTPVSDLATYYASLAGANTFADRVTISFGGIGVTGNSSIIGTLTLSAAFTVTGGGATINGSSVLQTGVGGWSSFNAGKQLLITTPTNTNSPAIAITDGAGGQPWALWNNTGTLRLSSMPAYSDSTTPPVNVFSLTPGGVTIIGTTSFTGNQFLSGSLTVTNGLIVNAGGASITGNISVAGNTTVTGSVSAGFLSSSGNIAVAGNANVTGSVGGNFISSSGNAVVNGSVTAGFLQSLGGLDVDGSANVDGALTVVSGAGISGGLTISGNTSTNGVITTTGSASVVTSGYYMDAGGTAPFVSTNISYGINASSTNMLSTAYYAVSDVRLKFAVEDITPEEGARWVRMSRPVEYLKRRTWNGSDEEAVREAGFIAQEQVKAGYGRFVVPAPCEGIPGLVDENLTCLPDSMLTLNPLSGLAKLTAAVKWLMQENERLHERLDELDAA